MAGRGSGREPASVDPEVSVAETLPRIYRRVLDAVGRLEELGARRDAARYRQTAIATYSGAWDVACHRRLDDLLVKAEATARDLERRKDTPRLA